MLLSAVDYLKLVAASLSADVAPAVQGKAPPAMLAANIDAIRELLKREAVLPGLLAQFIPKGLELIGRMTEWLPSSACEPSVRLAGPASEAYFRDILGALDAGAQSLLARRGSLAPGAEERISAWLREVAVWESSYYRAFFASPLPQIDDDQDPVQPLTADKLERLLEARLPQEHDVRISEFEAFPGGFTNETFFFTLHSSARSGQKLVVRKNSPRPFFKFWAHRAREEYEILKVIAQEGLPVPEPLWLFTDTADVDGDFYVMTRGMGRMVGTLKGPTEQISEELLLDLAAFLARLHAIPLERFDGYLRGGTMTVRVGDTVEQAVRKNVEFVYDVWKHATRLPSPTEAFTIDWLRRNVPKNKSRPVVVHTDCFVHNFLVTGDKVTTVVDWEAAHFGDPAEDLAYIKDHVSRFMDWQKFLGGYYAAGGQKIDDKSLDYYKCLLNFRNYFGTNIGVARIPLGLIDIRMIPLGSEYFSIFMSACVESTT